MPISIMVLVPEMPDQESNARPDNSSLGVFPNAGPINVMPNLFPNV